MTQTGSGTITLSAGSGLSDLIASLRGMTYAGTADYSIAGITYWSDGQLETVLDKHVRFVDDEILDAIPYYPGGGSVDYYEYRSRFRNFESGTAVFIVRNGTGTIQGTSLYTVDYSAGIVTFAADQGGTSYYLTGRSYDLNAAAADVWRQKASQYGASFDWSSDNMSVRRSTAVQSALQMARYYEGLAEPITVSMLRGDEC